MSEFSNALQILIEESGLSRASIAEATGIPPATLHSFFYGKSTPSVDSLEKLCAIFNPAQRANLVVAHLKDEIPPNAADLVRVVSLIETPAAAEEPPSYQRIRLPANVMKDFEFLMRKAMDQPLIVDSIRSTARILRGE